MKFMTAATMRNPNSLPNVLGRMQEENKTEAIKQETAGAAQEIMRQISSLSPEDQMKQENLSGIMSSVFEKFPRANRQATVKLMYDFQNHSIGLREAQGRAKDRETQNSRNTTLFNQGQEKYKHDLKRRPIVEGQQDSLFAANLNAADARTAASKTSNALSSFKLDQAKEVDQKNKEYESVLDRLAGETHLPPGVEGPENSVNNILKGSPPYVQRRYKTEQVNKAAEQTKQNLANEKILSEINKNNAAATKNLKGDKTLSVTDQTKIHDYLSDQAIISAGLQKTNLGDIVDSNGNPAPNDVLSKINQAVQTRIPQVTQLIKDEDMTIQQAYQAVERKESLLFQKTVKDNTQKALNSKNPKFFLRTLEKQNPDIAAKVREELIRIAEENQKKKPLREAQGANYEDVIKSMNEQVQKSDGYSNPVSTLR